MAGSFPTAVTTYTNPGPLDTTATEIGTRSHDEFHADVNDDLEQVMTKLGTGASTPSAGTVLRGTGTGTTAFGAIVSGDITDDTIVNADINSAAAIGLTKIAHVGNGNVLKSSGSANVGGQVVNADVSSSAAITVSKLAAGGTANRVAATADGTTMAMQQIVGAMVATETITNAHILDGTIRSFELENDAVTAAKLADNAVDTAAIIAGAVTNSQRVTGGTGGTTNSTAFTDFDAAMSVSYASSGGVLIAFFFATVTNYVVGDYTTLGISLNGTDFAGTSYQPTSSQYRGMAFALARTSGLAAGTYTIKPRWRTSNGSNQALQIGTEATMLILELKK
jgi:hypothetical protein